jgi:hypothetical protein
LKVLRVVILFILLWLGKTSRGTAILVDPLSNPSLIDEVIWTISRMIIDGENPTYVHMYVSVLLPLCTQQVLNYSNGCNQNRCGTCTGLAVERGRPTHMG